MRTMPVSSDALQSYVFPMEDATVRVTLRWNPTPGIWSLDLARDGVDILRGQRVVMGTDLLRAHNLGLGGIVATATQNEREDAGRDDLGPGKRVQLIHLSEAEIASALAIAVSP